jgi:hypothetical protein
MTRLLMLVTLGLDVMSVSRARRAPVAGPREAVPPEFR